MNYATAGRRLLPVLLGAGTALAIIWLTPRTTLNDWEGLGATAVAVLLGLMVMFGARFALREPSPAPAATSAENEATRARIAPFVIGVGTLGIVSIAVAVVVGISVVGWSVPSIQAKIDTVLLSVFSTVLAVFATWVGTVLAFYFTNESFRAASESARQMVAPTANTEPITDPIRMIAFDKITRYDLLAPETFETVPLDKVRPLFSVTVTRVPVFDKDRRVMGIVRKKLFDIVDVQANAGKAGAAPVAGPVAPAAGAPAAPVVPAKTIADYLKIERNQADALNFRFLSANATVQHGRDVLKIYDTVDIFINDHGNPNEPVKGWVTDDRLQ